MKLAVFAYQDVGYECLDFLIEAGEEVVAVVTHENDPKEEIWFRSVADLARRHGLPVYTPSDPNAPDFIDLVRRAAPEIIFSFYYRRLLAKRLQLEGEEELPADLFAERQQFRVGERLGEY